LRILSNREIPRFFFFKRGRSATCTYPIGLAIGLVFRLEPHIFVVSFELNVSPIAPPSTDFNTKTTPIKIHSLANVTQIDVLEEYALFLVLHDKILSSYPIELFTDPNNVTNFQKKAKKVCGHVNFFKIGFCLRRMFLCIVQTNAIYSTIKVLEPVEPLNKNRKTMQDFKVFKVSSHSYIINNLGILYSHKNNIHSFSKIKVMSWMFKWISDCESREFGDTVSP